MKIVTLLFLLSGTALAAKVDLSTDIKNCFDAKIISGGSAIKHAVSLKKTGTCTCNKVGLVAVNQAMQQGPYYGETPPLFTGYTRNIYYPINDPGFKEEKLTFKVNCLSMEMPRF